MKTNPDPESEDRVLREWVVDAPLPPRFQENVWSRIARAEPTARPSFWSGIFQVLAGAFERPRVAYSYAAVFLALGIAAGTWTAQVKRSHLEADLGQRYLQSINPYQQDLASR